MPRDRYVSKTQNEQNEQINLNKLSCRTFLRGERYTVTENFIPLPFYKSKTLAQ